MVRNLMIEKTKTASQEANKENIRFKEKNLCFLRAFHFLIAEYLWI